MKKLIFSFFLCGATMFPAFSQTYQELSERAVAATEQDSLSLAEKYIEQALKMEPAKSTVHHPDPFMAGIHQPFYMQVIAAAHQYLATDDLTRRNRRLHPFRCQHQLRRTIVNDSPGQTVNTFPHSTTCIFILLCKMSTLT